MRVKSLMILLTLLLLPAVVLAGGKIRGKVIDSETNEALIGASVAVEGTSYGAATDVDGEFTVLNVPVGVYTVTTSFVGYASTSVSNVRVNEDLTTSLDFQLTSEAVALATIEIIAERPLINPSATNAVRIVSGEDLRNIPIRGVASVVALQAGIVEQGGQLFIRGGRQDEVGYFIDGVDARNARDGLLAVSVVPEALEEFQVQAGGYNAEFGGANAGIVLQQLKTGSSKYTASLRVETDNFVADGETFLDTHSYGYSDYAATFGGPLFSDNIRFFLAGENIFRGDPTRAFWDGFTFKDIIEDQTNSNLNPNNPIDSVTGNPVQDVFSLFSPDGNVPGRKEEFWGGNGTLTFDYNPVIVRLSASLNYEKSIQNTEPVHTLLNSGRLTNINESSGLYSAKLTHFLQPTTYYELTLGYQDQRFKRFDPVFEDDYLKYGDSLAAAAVGLPTFFGRFNSPEDVRAFGFRFSRPGTLETGLAGAADNYTKRKQNYISAALNITHQEGSHEFKLGGSYQRYTIRQYSVGELEGYFGSLLSNPDIARTGGDITSDGSTELEVLMRTGGIPSNFGYDVFGNEIDDGFDGPKHPKYISAYIQDKIELSDIVLNLGLRFDSFDNDDRVFLDPKDPGFDTENITITPASTREVGAFTRISPRIGFSFPVSDRTVFHIQYGKFAQAPQLSTLYVGNAELARILAGRNFIPVPFGFGLEPERTTQYEIGFTHQFTDFASFDITTFYKDIKGQIQIEVVETTPGVAAQAYNVLQNGDFATTKGVEFTLRVRRFNRVQASVNYTVSDAQGTGSSSTSQLSSVENATPRPTVISPLTYNQAHRGTINFDYRFGKGDGGPILERLGANLLFRFNSGHPYTKADPNSGIGQRGPEEAGLLADDDPRARIPAGSVNNETTPWVFQLDLRLDKTVTISDLFDVNFYVYVQNLLNTKNVLNVYSRSGNADDHGFLTNPTLSSNIIAGLGQQYVEFYQAFNNNNRQHYWRNQLNTLNPFEGGDLFGPPRQIIFGINLTY
ncbi:MAG: TonB-dependent receptor [Nitrospirota bacterium]|nr:TonB-dependent receptor [Nitrospirota bacterium]